MDAMIEIMHFSVSILAMGVSGASGLGTAQTPYDNEDAPRKPTTHPRSRNSQSPLLDNAGVFQEIDVPSQFLRLSCSRWAGPKPIEDETF
jgi:hypothetical protein